MEPIGFDDTALGEDLTNELNEPNEPNEPIAAVGSPQPQPQPQPPRRGGLPGWAWALIGGGALVMIAIMVTVVIVVSSVLGAIGHGQAEPVETPAPAASDSAPATEAPAAGSTLTEGEAGIFSLDDQVDLGDTFPVWGYPFQDGWELVLFDQEGVNQSENAELGCLFTSSQNVQPAVDVTATDDLTDTLATVDVLEKRLLASGPEAKLVGELGSTDFGVNLAGAEERLEFLTTRVDYMNPEAGVSYTNEIAVRAMPLAEALMYVVLSCPTSLVDAGNSPFEELRAGLAVVTGLGPVS